MKLKEKYNLLLNDVEYSHFKQNYLNIALIGIYDDNYWYPLFNEYPKALEQYKLMNYSEENNKLAGNWISIINIEKNHNSFINLVNIIFKIESFKNANNSLKDLLNEFVSHFPSKINALVEFKDLLNEDNLNEDNLSLKL